MKEYRELEKKGITTISGHSRKIKCLSGQLWITAKNRHEDYILKPGDSMTLTKMSSIIIEALDESKFMLLGKTSSGLGLLNMKLLYKED